MKEVIITTSSNHRSIKEFYNALWKEESLSPGLKVEAICRHNTVIAAIQKVKLKHKHKILDLGCGNSDLTIRLSKYGETTAIDLSDEAIRIASRRYPHINFICASILDVPIEENSYDLIVSSEVIEHLTQDEQGEYVKLIYQSLAEEGYLVLTTPNKEVAQALGRKGEQPIENWLAIDELRKLLSDYFKILRIHTTYFEAIRYRIRNHYWLYYHFVEPIFRTTKSGLYTVVLAQKHKPTQTL